MPSSWPDRPDGTWPLIKLSAAAYGLSATNPDCFPLVQCREKRGMRHNILLVSRYPLTPFRGEDVHNASVSFFSGPSLPSSPSLPGLNQDGRGPLWDLAMAGLHIRGICRFPCLAAGQGFVDEIGTPANGIIIETAANECAVGFCASACRRWWQLVALDASHFTDFLWSEAGLHRASGEKDTEDR